MAPIVVRADLLNRDALQSNSDLRLFIKELKSSHALVRYAITFSVIPWVLRSRIASDCEEVGTSLPAASL